VTAPRSLRSTRIYKGEVINLRVDEIELPSGRVAQREVVEHRGAVAIVPITATGAVVLVRQFRLAALANLLEIPAGTVEPGESVAAALERELAEEIGMRATHVEPLCSFFPSPGFLTEQVHIFLAQDLHPHRLQGEEEDLTVIQVPLREARDLVTQGEIRDAKSIIGLLLAAERVRPG